MFRAKCKDLGIKPLAEQEAGFVERAHKGLSEEHFRLCDLGVGASAVPPLAEALAAPDCRVTRLDLSNNPLRDAGAAALSRLLPRCGQLQRLELRSVGLGDAGVAALFEGMRKDSLTSLDLSCGGAVGRNSLGVSGVEAAAKLLAQTSSLTWLSLAGTGISPDRAILLSKGLRQNLTLKMLDLNDNLISDAGASNILSAAISADLHELNMGHNEISDRAAQYFIALLDSERVSLEKLDLRGNKLSYDVAAAISTSLSMRNTSVSTLLLDGNQLGPLGAASLAKGLTMEEAYTMDSGRKVEIHMKYPRSLTTLKLSQNELKDEGATKLCVILTKNWTLTALDLSNNMITDVGARAVAKSVSKNTSLLNLSLSWNQIGDDGIDAIAQKIRVHEYLNALNIEANKFTEKGSTAIVDMLSTCTSICSLHFGFNDVSYNQSEAIKALLDKNSKQMEAQHVARMRREFALLSQREDQYTDLQAKLKSEERTLKSRNNTIKEIHAKLQESQSTVAQKISELDAKRLVTAETLRQISVKMKHADLQIKIQGESTAAAMQLIHTNLRRGDVQLEELRKKLDQLRTVSARQDSEFNASISRREKSLAEQKELERDSLLEKTKALKMLRIFLQCNENMFDPVKHHHAWKLVESHVRRRPSTAFQTIVTDVLLGLKPSGNDAKGSTTGLQPRQLVRTLSRSNLETMRRRDSKKLSYVDSDFLASHIAANSSNVGRKFQRQETRKGLLLTRTGIEQTSKTPVIHKQIHQGNENLGIQSSTFDKGKDILQNTTLARSDSSSIVETQQSGLPKAIDPPFHVVLPFIDRTTSDSNPTDSNGNGPSQLNRQDDRSPMSKDDLGENGDKIPKMRIKVPQLRLDGRTSPKGMLRNSEADARPEVRRTSPKGMLRNSESRMSPKGMLRGSEIDGSKIPVPSIYVRKSEDARSSNSFKVKLQQMAITAEPPIRKPSRDIETVHESEADPQVAINANQVSRTTSDKSDALAKPIDVFDSIMEAESFIKSAEQASVVFSTNADSLDFNDAEFDLGKVERMMNMHKMRVNRSRDEQLKLLDALSSEFQTFD